MFSETIVRYDIICKKGLWHHTQTYTFTGIPLDFAALGLSLPSLLVDPALQLYVLNNVGNVVLLVLFQNVSVIHIKC